MPSEPDKNLLFEFRSYDFAPGAAPRYLELFQTSGLEYVTRHLPLGGYWLTDTGALNTLHHIWIYRDFAHRAECRVGLAADKEWNQGFIPQGFPLILRQQSRFMRLEKGSETLSNVVRDVGRQYHSHAAGSPLFAGSWYGLLIGSEAEGQGEHIGRWRVVSGEGPGTAISLARFTNPAEVTFPKGPAARHEMLRPCSFSPLG
ncbi:NIPSNAP protein [Mesorhizobium sp. J18]|uniref:NIPSNAP family protein n=1 Tax=Mesorhizobium sp. J18 TaxID=935263 RepID=UPI00119A18F3|nr:NIPSNAP family protein [Mesorhizobium sp. J18]TWG99509.1 NIPSNAP protein [Mesorhizobium sp. J18]